MLVTYSFLRPENLIQKIFTRCKNIELFLLGYFNLSHPVHVTEQVQVS